MNTQNELQLLVNTDSIKKDTFNKMCAAILANYKKLSGIELIWKDDLIGYDYPAIMRLLDKLHWIIFYKYSPQSIPGFLTRIVTKGVKMQARPGLAGGEVYGLGHFRWDFKAYTLNDNEVKAIAMYMNIAAPFKTMPINNKVKYEFNKLGYEEKAQYFLTITNTDFTTEFKEHDFYFDGDKDTRDIYICVLKNANNRYRFTFGQSIDNKGKKPTAYDVLSCLTKYDIGTYDNFCSEFGYDTDSRKARKSYRDVLREWKNVEKLWTPEQINLLQEIQ